MSKSGVFAVNKVKTDQIGLNTSVFGSKISVFAGIKGAPFADFGPRHLRGEIRKMVIDFFL